MKFTMCATMMAIAILSALAASATGRESESVCPVDSVGAIEDLINNYNKGNDRYSDLPSYVIVIGPEGKVIEQLPDSIFSLIAGKVIFKVNRTELNLDSPLIKELTDKVFPKARSLGWELAAIDLRGAASPEGPYANNVRLGHGRARALADHLVESFNVKPTVTNDIEGLINSTIVAEDYGYLLWLLERADDPAAPLLRCIIHRFGSDRPDLIKSALQHADSGRVWQRLLREYYPEVRAARVVLYFRDPQRVLRKVELKVPELGEVEPIETPAPVIPSPVIEIERPHMVAASTNLLYDMFYMPRYGWAPMPNIGLEFYPRRGNFTYKLQFMSPYYHRWHRQKFFQIRDYHFESRRYFNPGKLHIGPYVALYAQAAKYGIGLSRKKGWQGEGFGGGLKAGWVVPLGSGRWRMEFHLAAGVFYTRYDPYVYGNPVNGDIDGDYYYDWIFGASSFRRRNHSLTWFGPTEVGITISYDLLYWRVAKKGVSVRRKEVWRP